MSHRLWDGYLLGMESGAVDDLISRGVTGDTPKLDD